MNNYQKSPSKKFRRDHRWFLFGGLIALTFCFLALAWPSHYIWLLAIIWGVFALSDSVLSFLLTMHIRRKGRNCLPYLAISAAGLLAGASSLFWPGMTPLRLVCIVAGWAFAISIGRMATCFLLSEDD